ncbi:hypothetical protein KIH87_03455 [Paraneptunicella aestuarii]|uniref:DUF6694 family lipoprotein n=1 Tax=Paraneptunicella aestuarii TaxID=2831148 RepID=UPI001E603C56|nr:DUF6694 family lipoprotein [Paraneptunicella aestuarii]UAA39426.1 hypothetical protein KIH87_03455 [Paraneptunicella aestuarii]
MKILFRLLILVSTISFLTACGEATFDSSSDAAKKDSIQAMMEPLSSDDKQKLEEVIKGIYMINVLRNIGNDISKEEMIAQVDEKLNGKTAKEILELGENIKEEMKKGMNNN